MALPWAAQAQAPAPTADTYVRPYHEPFQYGLNLGYYANGWSDESLATIATEAGSYSLRVNLLESFLDNYGYGVKTNTFNTYQVLGMTEMNCFVGDPIASHRDWTWYTPNVGPSHMFSNLYEPIWNPDGTVNQNNHYAYYLFQVQQLYGDQIRFWEIMNEPDFNHGASSDAWWTRAPLPAELPHMQAPVYHYIRMLRISHEVLHKYRPDAYITTGLGYPAFLDVLLRYTDNPNGGTVTAQYPATGGAYLDAVSFHTYPNYSLHFWNNAINGFDYTRTSDYSVNKVMDDGNAMATVLRNRGYDDVTYPSKFLLITETNVSRRTSGDRTGSDEYQRNFGIKALALAQKNNVRQMYFYALGERVDAPAPNVDVSWGDEIALMGLYENLGRDAQGQQRLTDQGRAYKSTSQLLRGYFYDAARTAALNLPASTNGAAFSKPGGGYRYVLWAKALVDNSEVASANYSFPAALGVSGLQRYEWDYSSTNAHVAQAAQNIALTALPIFLVESPGTTPVACAGTGSLLREQWDNVGGSTVGLPAGSPNSSASVTQFEQLTQTNYNYAARYRGYLCVPATGSYTFYVNGDDAAELYLSPDDNPANKVRIASCAGWTSGPHDFTRYASQQSAPVPLVAGQRYYVEALHQQSWGPGSVSVAWLRPDGTRNEPIPGSVLMPFVPTTVVVAPPVASTCAGTGTLSRQQWDNIGGNTVAMPASKPQSSSTLTSFEASSSSQYNYLAQLNGYVCPPVSGGYTFYIAGDNSADLYLSPSDDPDQKVKIASVDSWLAGPRDFMRYAGQQSALVQLVAGQRYYIEALHKKGWGPGYVAVAWQRPDGVRQEPIPGLALLPFVPVDIMARGTGAPAGPAGSSAARAGLGRSAVAIYPNPFGQRATVEFSVAQSGPVTLALYDLKGQLVQQMYQGAAEAGLTRQLAIEVPRLSTGLYVLRLTTAGSVVNQKVSYTAE